MSPAGPELTPQELAEDVVAFRLRRLAALGWEGALAQLLAELPELDMRLVAKLSAGGCPQELALRILL